MAERDRVEMTSFTLSPSVTVAHAALAKPVTLDVVEESNKRFFRCAKSEHKLVRLLLATFDRDGDVEPDAVSISRTDIFEKLTALKEDAFKAAWATTLEGAMDGAAAAELGIINARTKGYRYDKVRIVSMPTTLTILAPSIGETGSVNMVVIASKPARGLHVELTPANLMYLSAVVGDQIVSGLIHRQHPRESIPSADRRTFTRPGVSYSYRRDQVLAKSRGKRKFFTDGDCDAETMAVAHVESMKDVNPEDCCDVD